MNHLFEIFVALLVACLIGFVVWRVMHQEPTMTPDMTNPNPAEALSQISVTNALTGADISDQVSPVENPPAISSPLITPLTAAFSVGEHKMTKEITLNLNEGDATLKNVALFKYVSPVYEDYTPEPFWSDEDICEATAFRATESGYAVTCTVNTSDDTEPGMYLFGERSFTTQDQCSDEPKVCSDGSIVFQEGDSCEYAACPGE